MDSSKDSVVELWSRYREERCNDAKHKLIEIYLPYANAVAANTYRQYMSLGIEYADCLHFGYIGLLESLERYDSNGDASFETFSTYRIRGNILNNLDRYSERSRQAAYRRDLAKERIESISSVGGASDNAFDAMVNLVLEVAVSHVVDDSLSTAREECSPPNEKLDDIFESKAVADLLTELSDVERFVVTNHYFFEMTMVDIAEVMGVTKSRVSQIHSVAIKKLRAGVAKSW
ncbi:sigma-70 family RNA polymerase sigma factor [Hahella sp. HN01]|uniref:sigma-70 family RNA polymerase sigma factor n=1 Tax=unclassified Hahella TaxID=2624107 RepID=UPI001C1EC35B|nr:sigma-70 family RNA polymerase sigma factor [Hahella sp. HN01]MBU6955248.1 sigma-70 family RNA polymerase sigma factor [Hahella sp. HN01]